MPGKYDIEGYGTYEIDSDDDAEIQSTISEIIAHEKAARASRPTLGGPTGLASQRLAALGGKPESEKGDFAPQPTPIAGNAIPAIQPVNRPVIAPAEEPDTPSAFLTPELQSFFRKNKQEALRKARENTFPSVGDMAGNVADWAGRQKAALDADLDREAAAQAAEDAAGEARHDKYIAPLERRVGDILTGAGAAAREAIGGYGDVSPDATPIQRARLRRTPAPDLAGGGVRKYEPPKAGEPYLPLGAGVEQYRPVSEQAAARLAALRSGDDGTVRRENARPLFEGKALGEAPATFRLNPEDTLRATAPARYLENDYTKVHDWAQGAADDLGKWATEDTEHSALARLVDRGEKSDSLTANVLAAGAKGVTQAITSSAPALAEFAVLHRATPGAFKPLVDAAITSWFSGEGVGQVAEASPAVGTDIGSAIGGDPVPFNELAQHLGQLGMGAFMGATPLGAKSPIAKSIEGNRFLDPGLASGRSPEQARLYGEATRGQADREMASRAISVEEGTPMIGAFNRQPMTAPLTSMAGDAWDFLSDRQQPAVEALRRPRQRRGLWQDAGLRSPNDTMTAPAEPEASFTGPIDVFDLASGRRPTPYAPEMGPEAWEGVVPRLAPFEPPVGPPVPYSARERLANAQLLEGQGPPDLSRAERAMHSIPSGPEGQIRGPFPMPADVLAQGRTPPADLQARTGNAPRPTPPVDPEAARVLASILSGGEEPPPAPTLPARPPLPTVGDAPSWQDRQRAERASPAKPPAEENIQVEPKATTDAQLKMVEEGQGQPGKKPGVLYTVQGGAKPPDVVPEGLARVDGPAGTLIFDPSKVTPEQAREALTSGEGLDKALGFSGPRPEPHPDNAVVSVLGKDGVEKSSQVAGPTTFRTEQGAVTEGQTRGTSSYSVDAQGRTTRTKGQHFGHDTKDVGVKTPSDRTVYVDEATSTAIGMQAGLPKGTKATVIEKDGRLYPATWNDAAGKWGLAPSDRAGYPIVSDTPKVGLHPIELWGPREGPQGREYRSSHAGSRIVEVTPGDIEGAVKAAQGMAGKGDQVAVRTPDEVIADRRAGIEAEKKPPRSYDEIQREIDAAEERLSREGVDVTKLAPAGELLGLPVDYRPMPSELEKLYNERYAAEAHEDAEVAGGLGEALERVMPDAKAREALVADLQQSRLPTAIRGANRMGMEMRAGRQNELGRIAEVAVRHAAMERGEGEDVHQDVTDRLAGTPERPGVEIVLAPPPPGYRPYSDGTLAKAQEILDAVVPGVKLPRPGKAAAAPAAPAIGGRGQKALPPAPREDGVVARTGTSPERRVEDNGTVGRTALPKNDDIPAPAAAKFTVEPTTEIEFADGWWYPEGRKRSDSHPTGETRTRWYLYEDGENVGKYDSAHEANFAIKERQRLASLKPPPVERRVEDKGPEGEGLPAPVADAGAAPEAHRAPEPGVRPAAEVAPRRIPWRHSTDGMEVVPVEELKFDNGKWAQATGAPASAKWTGEKRTVGYAWKNRDGITVGKRYATEAEAKAALAGAKAKAEIEAREYQEANPVPEPDLRTVTRGDLNELVADPSFPPGEARARAEKPDEPVRYTHAEVQSEQLPVTREQRHAAGGRPIRGPVMKHVVLWGPDGQIVEKRPMGIGPLAVRRANKIVKELNERPAGGGILEQPEVPAEPPRDTQPTPAPAAEPVAAGARKGLLDERARSIEERRELQRKIREDDLGPKKLARAKEELKETELHLAALDKKLGYEAGGPTAAQVEADLKERFGDRYEPDVPEPAEAPAAEAPKGRPARVWVSPTEPLDVEYKIVEADTVRTSHDKRTGEPTPGFPQRKQPRDRSRESYLRQQAEIGQRPNPDLLLEGPEASVGAPITSEPGPEGIRDAEHGNGRTNGIRIAYEDGNAGEYRQRLIDDADRYGTTPEAVAGMREPILIRERKTDLSAKEQVSIAKESNKGTAERMGTAEQATVDAGAMTPELLSQFAPSESGDIMAASNRPFLRGFFSEIADSGDMVDRAGNVSAAGVARVKAAILAKAYGETSVLERALEAADDNTRNVSAGLLSAAPRVAKVRAMAESGELHPVDITTPIKEAVDHLAHARDQGVSVADYLDQQDLFGDQISPEGREVLSFLDKNKRSPKKIAGFIDSLARAVEAAGHPDQTDLFGGAPDAPSRAETFASAKRIYESRFESEGAQGGLFDQAGSGGPDRGEGPGATPGGGDGGPGGGRPGGGELGGKPRVFAYSSGKGVGRDPYAERTGKQAVPVPTFKRLPRTPPVRPPEGPLEVWKVETLAPNYAKLQDGRAEFLKDIHEFFSATTMDDPAKVVSNIKIATKAEHAFRVARLDMALRGMERAFDRLKPKDRMRTMEEFAMAGEERRKQATPELQAHWDFYHAMTEAAYADMQRYGHDKFAGYIKDQDYFARQFVNEGEATAFAHEWYDRKSVDGPKGFLKKRYYELLRDALAAGLKLKHDNPARALMEYQAGVQQFLGWQKESSRSIRAGIRKYLPIDREVPHGWDQIHPERGLVYGDPAVMLGEAITKRHLLMEEIAKDLGIKVDRLPGVGGEFGRAEIGGAAGARDVAVRAGTPVGILAHEIGHILDSDYKLWDEMMSNKDASPAVRTELRDLAALRYESKAGTVSQRYKDYVHTKEEQIANMLDAYVAEPNLLREVAPVALGEFRSFLLKNPKLHKFFEMEPGGKAAGLELEERVHRIPIKGKVVVGRWISPTSVVRLIDRDLSKGFQDKLAYRSLRNLTNVMNRIQLGFSGFHGIFTGLDSVTGNLTLALQEAVAATQPQHAGKGFGVDAAKRIASMAIFPVIPFRRYAEGHRLQKIAEGLPLDMPFEQMPQEIREFLVAGGRFWEDPSHAANQVRAFQKALDRSNPIGGVFHLPGAVIEMVSSLIMEKWVPRLKIGMFAQEVAFERKRLGPDATDAEIAYHTRRIQESVENRFGQLAYDNLLWHRAIKDIGQVTVRSLGWGLGSIRDIGGGIFDAGRMSHRAEANRLVESKKAMQRVVIKNAERDFNAAQQAAQATPTKANIEKAEKAGKALEQAQAAMPSNLNDPVFTRRMAYPIALGISVGIMGALYHLAKRGKLPANAKDFYAIPTGGRNKDGSEERVFLPTYAKEVYAWLTHPWETALHKLSPALATGAEIAKNQDYFGTKVREGNPAEQTKDSVEHWIRSLVPFSMRQLMQSQFPGSELGKTEAGLGITKAPASLSRSDAEEKLNEYLRRISGGIKTKAEAEKSKARSEIKALIRGGHDEEADAAIEKAIEEHQVSPDEKQGRRALYKAAAKTVLENTLRSMPVDEALEVYRKATPEERQRWADAFRARIFGSASRRPSWWKDRPQEEVEAIQAEAEKLLPPE